MLKIEGHTDNIGGEAFNQRLSEKRAKAVHDYLIEQGLDASTIVAKGFGETMPVETNDDAKGGNRTDGLRSSFPAK
jgi:outer membrane protein OmpA-like peptidoglycan-associated protein